MPEILHVRQDRIRRNAKLPAEQAEPPIVMNRSGKRRYGNTVELRLPDGTVVATFRYRPHHPLSCGARLWMELANGIEAVVLD